MNYYQDNIVAIATGTAYAGVGIIRISGYKLDTLIEKITGKTKIRPRFAHYSDFYGNDGEIIDSGLLVYFDSPKSFTGEDVVELQTHGSPVVLNLLLKHCISLGCRQAEPGEFTKRAYLNGKLDLIQAESIADLIHAESEASAKGAIKSLRGEFSQYINGINQRLINLRMFVEATLDFPDEDIDFIANAKIKEKLEIIRNEIYPLLQNTQQGVLLNNGANIVIIGQPNVGKSSLLNALANEEIAIVTDIAGTTRDIVKQKIIIDGIPFNIIDTAGIRQTNDSVEKIGIERAINAVNQADLCIILLDNQIGITKEDNDILLQIPEHIIRIYVHNKIDLTGKTHQIKIENGETHVYISAKKNLGIEELRKQLLDVIGWQRSGENTFTARTRHLNAMQKAVKHIDSAFSHWEQLEILAEELRYAHSALGEITGEFSADDLLGVIFSEFCIGK